MTKPQSFLHGIKSSPGYFISTFLFGVMFGITAHAIGLVPWHSLLMSATSFSASAQFTALEFWSHPLPFATIALSVLLVSTRNILLGMSMAHHFDGHSLKRKIICLGILNDPGVVSSFSQPKEVDRLSYVTGYGVSLMVSWLCSVLLGISLTDTAMHSDLGSVQFAGPMVMLTMMVLFIKGSNSSPIPWLVSGTVALVLFELGTADYAILLISVLAGACIAYRQARGNYE